MPSTQDRSAVADQAPELSRVTDQLLRLVGHVKQLSPRHQAWALVLFTTPVSPRLLDMATVEMDEEGKRHLSCIADLKNAERVRVPLSRTADTILKPGSGPLLHLMGAVGATGTVMIRELEDALRDVEGDITVASLSGAAECVAHFNTREGWFSHVPSADELLRRAGFRV